MRASYLWLVLLLLAATGSSQALLDDSVGDLYPQNDGGSGQDASDVCGEPFPEVPRDQRREGQLVPVVDHDGVWAVPASQGESLSIEVRPGSHGEAGLAITPALTVALREPMADGCGPTLASATIDGQAPATLDATIPADGTYSLHIRLDGVSTDLDSGTPTVTGSQDAHCAPVCVTEMELLVTSG